VFDQIRNDFVTSLQYLDVNRPNKTFINKNVAAGLFSRFCLVTNEWDAAIQYARMAREGYSLFTANELINDGFNNINSKEWMWGAAITSETTTMFASFFSFICAYDPGYGGAVTTYRKIDRRLYDSLGANDVRRQQFVRPGQNYTGGTNREFPEYTNIKFKSVPNWLGHYVFMRSSEMVLTAAEALARSGRPAEAAAELALLMNNRDPNWSATSVTGEEVYQIRRVELWGEGFSLFDHQRLKKGIDRGYEGTNHVASARFTIPAGSWYFLYQIPLRVLENNPNIVQNPVPEGDKF